MSVTKRPATIVDLPEIWALMDAYKAHYLDDFSEINKAWLLEMFADAPHLTSLVGKYGNIVGFVHVSEIREGLHCTAHVVVQPRYWRKIVQADVIGKEITETIAKYRLYKIKARILKHQSSARVVLKRYGFKQIASFWHETSYKNKPATVFEFCLLAKDWRKRLNGPK